MNRLSEVDTETGGGTQGSLLTIQNINDGGFLGEENEDDAIELDSYSPPTREEMRFQDDKPPTPKLLTIESLRLR